MVTQPMVIQPMVIQPIAIGHTTNSQYWSIVMPPIVIQPIAIRPTTIEFHICDHTATVEIKVWTSVMDIILTACGIAAPEQGVGDKDKLIETLRSK